MKKVLIGIVSALMGAAAGTFGINHVMSKKVSEVESKVDKFKGYYNMLNQWLILKQEGKTLDQYFVNNGYKTIAIYGMGEMGNRLYDDLKNTEIEIKYAIDKNASGAYSSINLYDIEDELEEVDVVIVTATFAFSEIMEQLQGRIEYPIVSLEDVIFEV